MSIKKDLLEFQDAKRRLKFYDKQVYDFLTMYEPIVSKEEMLASTRTIIEGIRDDEKKDKERCKRVEEFINNLSGKEYEIFNLKYNHGFTWEETADILGYSSVQVQRIHKAAINRS